MNRKESNRLILDFMGVKPLSTGNFHSWSDAPHYYTTEDTFEKVMDNISNYAKYDTSWDWLMPVVERIRDFRYNEKGDTTCSTIKEDLYHYVGRSRMEESYQMVLGFIKWHNSQITIAHS